MIERSPILTLRLLNDAIANRTGMRIDRLVKAKDLLRNYPEVCEQQAVNIDLFHNEQVCYSGIQVDQYQGATEWTAIGPSAVKALVLWYQIAQQEQLIDCQHVIETTEFYTPCFLELPRKYQINNWVLSKSVQKELAHLKSRAQQKVRLEKYLFGNLMRFFNYLNFRYDKKQHFLRVQIHQFQVERQRMPVFRQQQKSAYRIEFSVNFQLPQTLRLGQSTALGYGKVRTIT